MPRAVVARLRHYQDEAEARPDRFIRYDFPRLLDASREAVAALLRAPPETVVLVPNATEGVNTVLKNLHWARDGRDAILTFSTAYEACAKTADYIVDSSGGAVEHAEVSLAYPLDDAAVLAAFAAAVAALAARGKRARLCIFDVVSSRPGVVFPHAAMARLCRELGVLSLVDGAQGIGMVPLDLPAADPDFFVSNCHKWLLVPRGCAVLYVPRRNQHLLPSTLATSHGYQPRQASRGSPLPPSSKSAFVSNFEFVGTKDNSPYLCVKDAIAWRRDVLGGEQRIIGYLWDLNKRGIKHVADALGTHFLENSQGTLTNCAMANVALRIFVGDGAPPAGEADVALVPAEHQDKALFWMAQAMAHEYHTFMALFVLNGRFWARISAQVYLDMADYELAAAVLRELTERVARKEYQ